MKRLSLNEVRSEFLKFFDSKDHLVLPSFPLVPQNDKSLLLIGAGMAPMKKYFTGELEPPKARVATSQKCIRTGDLENVGKTDRHATYFEMLGNFSFGDYFKKDAIAWAWEFLTEWMEISEDDLWATVYYKDDEAYDIWKNHIGLPDEKIVRLGKEDNFWELAVGPSGPCSEVFVDRGEKYGCGDPNCKPGCECDRYIEVWNLVFTQFDKDEEGNYHPLKHPNIDTGMGLERLAAVLQEADNIFEVDALESIVKSIETMSNYKYKTDSKLDQSVRVITDHIRAMTFMIGDTIVPSNEGRGYVLRRIIRRAARHGRLLGIKQAFLYELADEVIKINEQAYPNLIDNREMIKNVIKREEERFLLTIEQGMDRLDHVIDELKAKDKRILNGEDVFKLYDTYGFPEDLTAEILKEQGFDYDHEGFDRAMQAQKERARAARDDTDNIGWSYEGNLDLFEGLEPTEFIGYEHLIAETDIIALIKDSERVDTLEKGDKGFVVLRKTPFYAEGGGQVGDIGTIYGEDFSLDVLDTQNTKAHIYIHQVEVLEGKAHLGTVKAEVNQETRERTRRNHSVTHLVHKALKEVLGDHVNQAGSLVAPDFMRFDFTHYDAMTEEEIKKVENIVNREIYNSLPVDVKIMSLEEAEASGAIGLFEDKYGDTVRVVSMGDFSTELCGGTHVDNTAQIGMFKILSESSISSGVRRIETMSGLGVYNYINKLLNEREKVAQLVKANPHNYVQKVEQQVETIDELKRELTQAQHEQAAKQGENLIDNIKKINDIPYISARIDHVPVNELRNLAEQLRDKAGSLVVVLGTEQENGKVNFVSAVSKDLIAQGIKAGDLVKDIAKVTKGGGGGRPDMATAGGKDASKLDDALALVKELLANK